MKISNLFKKLSKIVLTLALVGGIINTYGKAGEVKAAQTVKETLDFDSMESSSGPGWSWNSGDKVLELNGFNQDVNTTESDPAIELPAGSTIKLIENSTNTIKSPSIGVYGINITIEGSGSLVIDAETYGIESFGLEPGLEINGVELQTSNIVCEGPIYINSGIAKVNSILGYALVVGDDGIIEVKNNVEIINIGSNLPDPSNVANAITAKYMAGANEPYTSGVTQQLTKNNNATVMTISGKEIENAGQGGGDALPSDLTNIMVDVRDKDNKKIYYSTDGTHPIQPGSYESIQFDQDQVYESDNIYFNDAGELVFDNFSFETTTAYNSEKYVSSGALYILGNVENDDSLVIRFKGTNSMSVKGGVPIYLAKLEELTFTGENNSKLNVECVDSNYIVYDDQNSHQFTLNLGDINTANDSVINFKFGENVLDHYISRNNNASTININNMNINLEDCQIYTYRLTANNSNVTINNDYAGFTISGENNHLILRNSTIDVTSKENPMGDGWNWPYTSFDMDENSTIRLKTTEDATPLVAFENLSFAYKVYNEYGEELSLFETIVDIVTEEVSYEDVIDYLSRYGIEVEQLTADNIAFYEKRKGGTAEDLNNGYIRMTYTYYGYVYIAEDYPNEVYDVLYVNNIPESDKIARPTTPGKPDGDSTVTITKIQDTKYEDTGYSVRDYVFEGLDILEADHTYYFELYKSDEKSIDDLEEEFDEKIGKYYEGQKLVANSSAQILWLVNNNNPDLGYSLQFSYFNETNSYDTVVIVDATTREMVDYQIFSLNGSNVNTAPEITDLSIAIGDGKSNIFDELVAGKPLPDVQLSFLAKTDVGDYEIGKYLNTNMGPIYSWSYREKGSSKWMPTFMEPNHTVSESYDYMLMLNVGLITGVDGVFSLAYEKDITNVVTLKNESMLSDYDITAISFVTGAMIAIEPKSNGTEGGETPADIKVSLNDDGLLTATAEAGIYTSTGSNVGDFFGAGTEVSLGDPTNFVRVFVYTKDGEELPDGTILKVTAKNATVTELGWTGEGFYYFEVKGIAESTVIYINEEVEDPTDQEEPTPVKPTITTQPTSSVKVEAGSISGSLSVVATGSDLSYQWYQAVDANKTKATAITGAKSATFDIPKDLGVGTYYYYCTVSLGGESVDTDVTTIVVTAKEDPEDPAPEDPAEPEEPGNTPEDDNTATDGDLSGKDPVIVYPVRPSKPTTAVGKLNSTTSKVETIINSGTVEEVNKVVEATLATDYLNVEINDNGVKYSATEAEKYSVRIDNLNTVVTALLTNDEIVQAASGKLNASILLETEVVVIKDIPETTKAMIGDATPVGYQLKETVDISLYKVLGSEKTQIKETSAGIEVTMELPESIRNEKDIKIIRIHNEGTPEEEATVLTSVVNGDGTITFVTDRFSTYAFVTSDMDLSAYSNFGLEVYHNSRVISVENTKNGFDVFGYMWIDYVTPTKNTWREIIFVNTEDASTDKAYRVNANAVYNTFLNPNMYATRDGKVDLSYACYKANVNTNSISSYDKKSTGKMASGTYYAFMRISDGKDSYLFPLVDRVLSDGSTMVLDGKLPANFSLSDDLARTIIYTVE